MTCIFRIHQRGPRIDSFGDLVRAIKYRGETPIPWDEILLAVKLADLLEVVGHLVPVRQFAGIDLFHQALIHIELQPASIWMEDISLIAGRHLGVDISI